MNSSATVLLNRLLSRGRLRHVQTLVRLAELGSIRRTAEAIGLSQPRVTQILADLEEMLEVQLFQRHARGVRPTAACGDLLPMARQLLQGLATSAEALAARRGHGEGVIRLMAITSAINGMLLRALSTFADRHRSVQVQLGERVIDDILLAIRRDEVDLVACREPAVVPEGWTFRPLQADEMVVACSSTHPLARRRRIHWDELAHEEWLLAPAGTAARAYHDEMSLRFGDGIRAHPVVTRVTAATAWLLRHRRLLVVVPFGVVRHLVDAGELAVLRTEDRMPLAPLGILVPETGTGPATAKLVEHLSRSASGADPRPGRRDSRPGDSR
jgi:DNA-binding transcriptional LysR family regulator